MSDAYDMIDRFLRNNLGSDDDYAEYSKALDSLCCAQPSQAGHVPEASCGECGKKASDGWVLYCVACMEEVGLPAQAEQVLTDDRLLAMWEGTDGERALRPTLGKNKILSFARAIEQAVMAKRVPLALDQIKPHFQEYMVDDELDFVAGVRFAERHHGIGGEKGGA